MNPSTDTPRPERGNRNFIYKTISNMLDNPNGGIYHTADCYNTLEAWADAKDQALEGLKEENRRLLALHEIMPPGYAIGDDATAALAVQMTDLHRTNERLREAALTYKEMMSYQRIGRPAPEELLKKLDKAAETLAALIESGIVKAGTLKEGVK